MVAVLGIMAFLVLGITGTAGGTATAAGWVSAEHVTRDSDAAGAHEATNPRITPSGVNGQQFVFVNDLRFVIMVCLTGLNQDDKTVTNCWLTPDLVNHLAGWWWHGRVTVSEYTSGLVFYRAQYAHVPRFSPTDWWCFSELFGDLGPCR